MSAVDPIAAMLADLDRPAATRPAFADALLERLLSELTAPTSRREPTVRLVRLASRRLLPERRWRIAVAIAILLLLLAGIATATYLGVRSWVSSSPRGVQHTSDYRLTTVFTTHVKRTWSSFSLGPGGHDLYALRTAFFGPARGTELVRLAGVDRSAGPTSVDRVLDFQALAPPNWRSWNCSEIPTSDASNGDVFLATCGTDVPYRSAVADGLGYLLLYVLHPDGSHQRILTGDDLVRLKLAPSHGGWWPSIAASAPDRVWIWVDPFEGTGPQRLVQVLDPNADDDWSDRIVREIQLPRSLPFARRPTKPFYWYPQWRWQLAAEPPLRGDDRSRSVLASTISRGGTFRIYRIADSNRDGDALDSGEVRLLLERRDIGGSARIAAHVVMRSGVAEREIVVDGLDRPDRISLVTASGRVRSIARSFGQAHQMLAGPNGTIYVVERKATLLTLYRLEPTTTGTNVGSTTSVVPPARTAPIALPVRTGAPHLVFELTGPDRGESFTIGADGGGLARLIPGTHVEAVCQSADGRHVMFSSDAEVPRESFTYLASDGKRPEKVFERSEDVACPFSARWLLLTRPIGGEGATRLVRHDLRSGRETEIADDLSYAALSHDGTKIVAVGGLSWRRWNATGRQTLQLVDLETLRRHRLAGPHGTAEFGPVSWSPDDTRIAYYTGPRGTWSLVRRRLVLWVRDVSTGAPVLRVPITGGGRPSLSWSSDGTRLLVCIENRGWQPACPAGLDDHGAINVPHMSGRLWLVDLRDGTVRVVARGRLTFAGWAPSSEEFAYAIRDTLFLGRADGTARMIATVPEAQRHLFLLAQPWLGWSPDARYIGLGIVGHTKAKFAREKGIPVIEVATGKVHVLRPFGRADYTNVQWWRQHAR